MKKGETSIQNSIRIALSQEGCIVFRANVGLFYTPDGRRVHIGEKGHSDLYGHRPKDGKAFYIETKTPIGKLSVDQKRFIKAMIDSGAIAGVARNIQDAKTIVLGG